MSESAGDTRLSQIETAWTLLRRAKGSDDDARAARQLLVARYRPAVHRYLRKAVGAADADDLAQRFSLALLEGKLAGADPARGKFRRYLAGALGHMIAGHYRQARAARSLEDIDEPAAPAGDDAAFDAAWREQLLMRALAALKEVRQAWHEALVAITRPPRPRSDELARALTERLGRPYNAASARQVLRRARERFADLLVAEVAHTLEGPTPQALAGELAELGLLERCREALRRRGG